MASYFAGKGVAVGQRLFRAGRVVAVSYGIYQCGYQAGLSEVINNPVATHNTLMHVVLQSQGATGESKDVVMKKRSRTVGKRILISSRDYCLKKYNAAVTAAKAADIKNEDDEEEVLKWKEALEILRNHEWTFVVIDAPTVNAFVHHMLPGKVFIHEGLFRDVKPTDDELALILSHELSHVIHQHGRARNELTMFTSVIQLVLFSFVDPSGALPFLFDILLKQFSAGMENYYSRENETEADLTGIEIAAHACFETRESHDVFGRLSDGEHYWNSTHPSGESRVAYLLEASGVHNPEIYGDKCKKMKGLLDELRGMLKGSR